MVIKIVTEPAARTIALENGELDFYAFENVARNVVRLKKNDKLEVTSQGYAAIGPIDWLAFNTKKGKTERLYFDTASYGAVPKIKNACSKPTINPKPVKPTISMEIPIGIFSAIKIRTDRKASAPLVIGSKFIDCLFQI